jgi:hypothetical protein
MPVEIPTRTIPEQLDSDMTPADLIAVLQRLPFRDTGTVGRPSDASQCVISIDRGVRDYRMFLWRV